MIGVAGVEYTYPMNHENTQDKPASCQECLDKLGLVRESQTGKQDSEEPAKDWAAGKKAK